MAIIHNTTQKNYTQVSNGVLRNKALSWKARGLLAWLLGCSDGFEVSIHGIVAMGIDGEVSVRSGISELKEAGYVVIHHSQQSDDGTFSGQEWTITDAPTQEIRQQTEPYVSRTSDKPNLGEPTTNKTKLNKIENNNIIFTDGYLPSAGTPTAGGFLPPTIKKELQRAQLTNEQIAWCASNFKKLADIWMAYPDGRRRKKSEIMIGFCRAIESDPTAANELDLILKRLKALMPQEKQFLPSAGTWAEGMGWRANREVIKPLSFQEQRALAEGRQREEALACIAERKKRDDEMREQIRINGGGI